MLLPNYLLLPACAGGGGGSDAELECVECGVCELRLGGREAGEQGHAGGRWSHQASQCWVPHVQDWGDNTADNSQQLSRLEMDRRRTKDIVPLCMFV